MNNRSSIQAWLMVATGLGIVLFWATFFSLGLLPENAPPCYLAFERAFPPPDCLLALGLVLGGILALKGNSTGTRLALACAGGLLFLGVIDITFNIQNGIYLLGRGELLLMAAVNAWCVGFGASLLIRPPAVADLQENGSAGTPD